MAEKPNKLEETSKEAGIKIEKAPKAEGTGIRIEPTPGELPPPLEKEVVPPEEVVGEEVVGRRIVGKIPISPAVIKPPLRLEGTILAQVTGYPGWIYAEEELDAIAELIAECGWEMDARLQIVLAIGTLHGGKFMAMKIWERQGRPGDLKRTTGEVIRKEKSGEEIRA